MFMTEQALKPYMLYHINMSRTKAVKEILGMPDLIYKQLPILQRGQYYIMLRTTGHRVFVVVV